MFDSQGYLMGRSSRAVRLRLRATLILRNSPMRLLCLLAALPYFLTAPGCGVRPDEPAAESAGAVATDAAEAPAEDAVDPPASEASSEVAAGEDLGDAVVIPLEEIWGLRTPGTKKMLDLEPGVFYASTEGLSPEEFNQRFDESLIIQVRRSLKAPPSDPQTSVPTPGEAFAVRGHAEEALAEVHRVLAKGEPPESVFQVGDDVSLCFFSYQAGTYVHLTSVLVRGSTIEVHYRFQVHWTTEMSEHFTLIPLTGIKEGVVNVEVIRDPSEPLANGQDMVPSYEDWHKTLVCRGSTFRFVNPPSE